MKSCLFLFFLCFSTFVSAQCENSPSTKDTVETFGYWKDLFRFQDYYISAQPELKHLEWLKEQGVTKIINLNTDKENREFSDESYNEKQAAKKMGFDYSSLPINGNKDYHPKNLVRLTELLGPEEKFLIHCKSGGRATYFFVAYLIKEEGFDINRAVKIGKQMRYSSPLEDILGIEMRMEMVK